MPKRMGRGMWERDAICSDVANNFLNASLKTVSADRMSVPVGKPDFQVLEQVSTVGPSKADLPSAFYVVCAAGYVRYPAWEYLFRWNEIWLFQTFF